MAHLLDDVRARLARADEHISDLEREIADFRGLHPNLYRTDYDPKTAELSHRLQQEPAPPRFSVIAGEVLFLLRSSLDHLVGQLLLAQVTPPANLGAAMERSTFPICDTANAWKSFDWTKIPDVSAQVRTAIAAYQPCNRTDGLPPEDHPLAVLSSLNNIDKHRKLLVLTNKITASHKISMVRPVEIRDLRFETNIASTESETDLARGHVEVAPDGDVDVQSHVTTEIAFQQFGSAKVEPVIPALQGLLKYVTDLVADFEARFF